jgi:hypothetical protein
LTLRIDRSLVSESEALALDNARDVSAIRRERNIAAGLCLNENQQGTHGPATHGCRCARCYMVHLFGAAKVREVGIHKLAREHGIDLAPAANQNRITVTAQQGA